VGCNIVQFGENPKFQQNISPTSSEWKSISKEAQNVCLLLVSFLFYSLTTSYEYEGDMHLRNVSHRCKSLKSNELSLDDAGMGVGCGSFNFG
jgi:hypothetical protein